MGDLIVLTTSKSSSYLPLPPSGGADILFFTGVRYFRMAEDAPELAAPKRRRRPVKAKTILAAMPYDPQVQRQRQGSPVLELQA